MTVVDSADHQLTGASPRAAGLFQTALRRFQCYIGDPVAPLVEALEDSPGFVMGHAMHAWLHLAGSEPAGVPVARAALAAVEGQAATARERGHLHAISLWADGHWRAAGRALEDVSIDAPRDALALQVGHLLDFYCGDQRMQRDRIARALPHWSPALPGYHALLGMHAFGLEENGQYAQAEAVGRQAVSLDRRDGWAWHAVAHVMEMQNRVDEGIAWLRHDSTAWTHESGFAVHNWWHLALFHLEHGDIPAVLELFDGPIHGHGPGLALELVDASAMLWRLQLLGVDVGERWAPVAEAWAAHADTRHYAFNDVHAAMAFLGAGRRDLLARLQDAQEQALSGLGDNAAFTSQVGLPLVNALEAFVGGDYRRAARGLRHVRPVAQRFGGSHAQRDLVDLTLIEAALRGGEHALARALTAERAAQKPERASAAALLRRALAAPRDSLAA